MSLSSPLFLAGLLLIPALLAAYLWRRHRANRYAVRFTATSSLRAAATRESALRRWLAPVLLLAAVASLVTAMAKPTITTAVPVKRATVVLVSDHSGSMQADDVKPSRMDASKQAARTFLRQLPKEALAGLVAYSTQPDAAQAPTSDHASIGAMIDAQQAYGATATGDALQVALDLLNARGKHGPSAIVLLSDGATTAGREPVAVAQMAKRLRIPIFTIALGTRDATLPNPDPFGPPIDVAPDPGTLKRIAAASGGQAFSAQSDAQLSSIYKRLGTQLGTKTTERQVTAFFAAGGLVLLLGAAFASLSGAGRLP